MAAVRATSINQSVLISHSHNNTALGNHINALGNHINGTGDEMWKVVEQIAFDMETVYLWVILALGFPGNCAAIVTVIKMFPGRSLTMYVALLAAVDNLSILVKILMFVLLDKGMNVGNLGCKTLGYFGNVLSTFANWLLVAMSIERFAAVWFPLKFVQIWSPKKSIATVMTMAFLLAAMFLHLFWIMRFVDDKDAGMKYCSIYDEYKYFMMHIWYWINVIIYAVLPCILLMIFNALIVVGIVQSRNAHRQFKGYSCKDKQINVDRHRPVTLMLVAAAVSLVILTTPRCVMLILTPYWTPPAGTMEGSVEYLIDCIAFVLCDFTHAINFYVYSLSTEIFRRQFIDILTCRKPRTTPIQNKYASLSFRTSLRFSYHRKSSSTRFEKRTEA
ncbi:probable G-protein coupled receptor B0563.6 [Haliotis asinina]|uniref:probable G-protein coupled receptor B0563.6 n=1 Tax=Haliotis asinina TaxID=109174 RepID=UPI003531FFBB